MKNKLRWPFSKPRQNIAFSVQRPWCDSVTSSVCNYFHMWLSLFPHLSSHLSHLVLPLQWDQQPGAVHLQQVRSPRRGRPVSGAAHTQRGAGHLCWLVEVVHSACSRVAAAYLLCPLWHHRGLLCISIVVQHSLQRTDGEIQWHAVNRNITGGRDTNKYKAILYKPQAKHDFSHGSIWNIWLLASNDVQTWNLKHEKKKQNISCLRGHWFIFVNVTF